MAHTTSLPAGLAFRSAEDADWPAMRLLAASCFGAFRPPETDDMWRKMTAPDGAVVVCDGPDIVGMSVYLDLQLTVPGGVVLPTAGMTAVAVAPTHRRRGLLREMFGELHRRMADSGYPMAALLASEGGIYGRFGYGPATVVHRRSIERRGARCHPEVPDPGGVRVVQPRQHREELAAIYDRWRRRTPGGLQSPPALWDEVLADREFARHGGSPFFALLHADGFAMYRVRGETTKSVDVTKLAAVTADAHIALWRVLLGLDLMDTITVETHPADPLPYLLTDPRRVQTTGWEDGLWLRMVDIPAVLLARTYQADLSAVLEISDPLLGGGGRFALDIRDGQAQCAPTDASPNVHTDLSVLGSIYLGAHHASAVAVANRLRCNDSRLLHDLDAAFATEVPAELGYGF